MIKSSKRPIAAWEIRNLFSIRMEEFGKECTKSAVVVLVSEELQVDASRVWRAIDKPVAVE